MSTIFSKIIKGEIPSHKIYENEYVFAFLDIQPLEKGHTLIVPKIEVDKFNDVPEPYYSAVFVAAKKIANAIEKSLDAKRIVTKVIGTDVPHFHYHLMPLITKNPSGNKPIAIEPEEMEQIATKIRQEIQKADK